MKFGIFTVSIPDYEPEQAIDVAADLGYDGLEWRVTKDEGDRSTPSFWKGNRSSLTAAELIVKAPALKAKAKERGIEFPSLGTYLDCYNLDAVEEGMKAAVAAGAKNLRIGTGGYNQALPHGEQMAKAKAQYRKVAELAGKHGVRAVVETHHGLITPTVALTMQVLEGLPSSSVGIMWDPGNQVIEGREQYRMALDIAGEYLAEIHVKNCVYEPTLVAGGALQWRTRWCSLQAGFVNWTEIMGLLKAKGYSGWIIFEDFSTDLPLAERLKANIAFFKALA